MKEYIFILFMLLLHAASFSQSKNTKTFLQAYENYRLNLVSKVKPIKAKRKLQNYHKSHIVELDTIFQSYKARKGFDFNTADTIYLIYNWAVESPFTNDIIIWSGKDTISYSQGYELIAPIKPYKYKRTVTYESFTSLYGLAKGYRTITERDSLITLVSKRDYNTILNLGDNQSIIDGGKYNIYVAIKGNNNFTIESCSPRQFWIETIYR